MRKDYLNYFNEVKISLKSEDIANMNEIFYDLQSYLSENLFIASSKVKKEGSLGIYCVSRTKKILDIDIVIIYDDRTYSHSEIKTIQSNLQSLMVKYEHTVVNTVKRKRKIVECECIWKNQLYSVDIVPVLKTNLGQEIDLASVKWIDDTFDITKYKCGKKKEYFNITKNRTTPRMSIIIIKNIIKNYILDEQVSLPSFYIKDIVSNKYENKIPLNLLCHNSLCSILEDASSLKYNTCFEKKYMDSIFYSVLSNDVDKFISDLKSFIYEDDM